MQIDRKYVKEIVQELVEVSAESSELGTELHFRLVLIFYEGYTYTNDFYLWEFEWDVFEDMIFS